MLQLIILLLGLAGITYICYRLNDGAVLSPQFAFAACFIPQTAYAFFFINYWSIDLSYKTVGIVLFGAAWFAAVSFFIAWLFNKRGVLMPPTQPIGKTDNSICCSKWHLWAFLALQVITLVWTLGFLINVYGKFDIVSAISHFNDVNKFSSETIELPFILGKLKILSIASGYIFSYLLFHGIINKYATHRILIVLNILFCFVNSLITGSRTDLFQMLCAFVVQFYFIYGKAYGWKIKISFKAGALLAGAALLLVFSFQGLGNLLGRGDTRNVFEYIGIYLSAELKNLDTFVREGQFGAPIERWQTLIAVVNLVGQRFGMPHLVHKFDLPFKTVNGRDLGNVATTFYAFLYDGGFWGVVIFVAFMAVICQVVYRFCTRKTKNNSALSVSTVIYSYIFFTIVFSFFSNKFYEHIFSPYFVYLIVFWLLLKVYFEYFTIDRVKEIFNKIKK